MMLDRFFFIHLFILVSLCSCGEKNKAIQEMSGASLKAFNGDSVVFLKHPNLYALVVSKSSVDSGEYRLFKSDLSASHLVFKKVSSGVLGVNATVVNYEDLKFLIQGGGETSVNVILGGTVVFESEVNSYKMAVYPSTDLKNLDLSELDYTSNEHISSAALEEWISSQIK